MFEGVSDQTLHQFVTSRTSLPLPPSFPRQSSAPPPPSATLMISSSFDPYNVNPSSHQLPAALHPHLLQPLHLQSSVSKNGEKEEKPNLVSLNLDAERERSIGGHDVQWTTDEVLALLRIRSCVENWFPEFTWEHVSRKLAELGFRRSAEKCREKFEEESRYFSSVNYGKNYRFLSELEEQIYHGGNADHVGAQKKQKLENNPAEEEAPEAAAVVHNLEDDSRDEAAGKQTFEDGGNGVDLAKSKKRKKEENFEMFMGFCEEVVKQLMARQEELHNRLLEDMVKRDEERVAKEEDWKKQELEKMNKELETMAHEQAIAGDRQATLIEFLKKFTSSPFEALNRSNSNNPSTSSPLAQCQKHPNPSLQFHGQNRHSTDQNNVTMAPTLIEKAVPSQNPSSSTHSSFNIPIPTSSGQVPSHQNPNSIKTQDNPFIPSPFSAEKSSLFTLKANEKGQDTGKRWPKDEVLALINLRCSLYNNSEGKEGVAKAPLWERISQAMLQMGYKRSAKRCKEKWENINKYFRKTKDVNKKRPMDSRTCPYFHQLNTLYNQGTLVSSLDRIEKSSDSPENHSSAIETLVGSSDQTGSSN